MLSHSENDAMTFIVGVVRCESSVHFNTRHRKDAKMSIDKEYSSAIMERVFDVQLPKDQIVLISGKDNKR